MGQRGEKIRAESGWVASKQVMPSPTHPHPRTSTFLRKKTPPSYPSTPKSLLSPQGAPEECALEVSATLGDPWRPRPIRSHLAVHCPCLVPVWGLVGIHLLLGDFGELLRELPPALGHLHGRGQQHKILDEPDDQPLAVHFQQGLKDSGENQTRKSRQAVDGR